MSDSTINSLKFSALFPHLESRFGTTQLCESLTITRHQLAKLKEGYFNADLLYHVSMKCNFSMNRAFGGEIYVEPVIQTLQGIKETAPHKYTLHTHISKKIIKLTLSQVPKTFMQDILTELQISHDFIFNEDVYPKVSVKLLYDLIKVIGLIEELDLVEIGKRVSESFANYQEVIQNSGQIVNILENHFENIYSYEVQERSSREIILKKKDKDFIANTHHIDEATKQHFCHYMQGRLTGCLSKYLNQNVQKTCSMKCLYKGDAHCEYHLTLSEDL